MKKARAVPESSVHLDAVRGLAALVVFLSHVPQLFLRLDLRNALVHAVGSTAQAVHETLLVRRPQIGHEAVVVFFVLSGYFVGGSTVRSMSDGRWAWKHYLLQRLTRLWVVLIPALCLGWVLDTAGLHLSSGVDSIYTAPATQHEVAANVAAGLGPATLCGNILFLQGLLVPVFGTNMPLWSLSYEFWYYVAFPFLAIALAAKHSNLRRILALLAVVALLMAGGTSIASYFVIWLMGVVVAQLPLKMPAASLRWTIPSVTILLLMTIVLLVGKSWLLYPSDIVTALVFSALLWLLLHCRKPAKSSLYRTVASGIAGMSYTLYAVHLPILVFLNAILMPHWSPWPLTVRSLTLTAGVLATTFLAAHGMYLCFEARTDQFRRFVAFLLRLQDDKDKGLTIRLTESHEMPPLVPAREDAQ
jgi:peptidoglycan/LPS O-acetylase OafA/YrhL